MSKLSRNAAIAQPVERILGKDEVASSNLASSSKAPRTISSWGLLLTYYLFTLTSKKSLGLWKVISKK